MLKPANFIHLGLGWIGDRGGGLERYQDGVCAAQAAMGISSIALVQSRVPVANTHGYRTIAFASLDDSRSDRHKKLRREIASRLGEHPSATLVTHHASVSYQVMNLIGDREHVVHFQGPWADEAQLEGTPRWKAFVQRRQEKRVYHSADRIITLSTAFKDLVVQRYGVDVSRVRVVPGAIDAAAADPGISRGEARTQLGWPLDRPILLSIRRLVKRVGIDSLIDAIERLRLKHPNLLVLIGGTGPMKAELEAMIERVDLHRNVRMLGFVPDEHLAIAYRAADYSIVPTQALEGFGLVTLESMATGTPAIVTPVGSLPEVCGPLSPSLVLPGKSPEQIAAGLDEILSGRAKLPSEEECKDYVKRNYDWSVIAPKVLEVYREAGS